MTTVLAHLLKKSIPFLFSGNRDMARERCHGNLHAPNKRFRQEDSLSRWPIYQRRNECFKL